MFNKISNFIHRQVGWDENHASQANSDASDEPGLPNVYSAPFFYGRITRCEAEEILKVNGMKQGQYLLRESITPMGNYSFTIVHEGSAIHYSIEKKMNGTYVVSDGEPFPDPLTLIQHYKKLRNGFATVPKVPCERLPDQEAVAFRGLSWSDLHAYMKDTARKMNANMSQAFGPKREYLLLNVLQTLHEKMPWFHGEISRDEGIKRLEQCGHLDGRFIVRKRQGPQPFALTMSHEGNMRHYLINQQDGDSYAIDAGPSFKALIVLIDHYHNKRDGLPCRLVCPCPNQTTSREAMQKYEMVTKNLTVKQAVSASSPPQRLAPTAPRESSSRNRRPVPQPPPDSSPCSLSNSFDVHPASGASRGSLFWDRPNVRYDEEEEVETAAFGFPEGAPLSIEEAEQLEKTYIHIREDVIATNLQPSQVNLQEKLGSGQFGEVRRGTCEVGGKIVPVAVKTLKNNDPEGEKEIWSEANLMKMLDHQHIVRLIGVCKAETLMLVLELADLGPLKKYLDRHKHQQMKVWHQVELMVQICEGMAYLESKDVVHRDLATRNVLLVNEHFAKISDFGLSRLMDASSDYYTAHGPGRWPLMWYAPECLYYHKFDSSSDVWSFGITMWEIMSLGARPYAKKKPNEILAFLEHNNRLANPKNCPNEVYQLMLDCWEWHKERRPTFRELRGELSDLCKRFKQLRE